MTARLRDVIVAQHRRLLNVFDRVEVSLDDTSIIGLRRSLTAHMDAETALVYPTAAPSHGTRYGTEQHVLLRFMLDRLEEATSRRDRATRVRVLRDLFVHYIEREELVTLELLERRLDEKTSIELGRQLLHAVEAKPASPPRLRAVREEQQLEARTEHEDHARRKGR